MTAIGRWALFLFLLTGLCSCAHRSNSTDTANRTEQETSTLQTAASAAEKTQSVATEKKQGSRDTKRFRPDGTLMEHVIEQWGSDGRIQVDRAASASASATRADFRSVRASSSSTRASSTSWWPPWWLWLLAAALLTTVVCWARWRARRLRML